MKLLSGVVINKSGDKTVRVSTVSWTTVRKYNFKLKKTKKLLVHDEENILSTGDEILFTICRKLSARKYHKLIKVVSKGV